MKATIHEDSVKVESGQSLFEVAKVIRDNKVRHAYVVEKNKLVGVVGGIDIINKAVAEGKDVKLLKAKDIMNDVKFVTSGQKIEYAYAIMRNFNTFTCPVVNEHKELIGYYKFAEACEAINNMIESN